MDHRPKNTPPDSLAASTETSSTQVPSGHGKESLAASKNAAKSAAILRWLGETPDQEHWNIMARLKEWLTESASKEWLTESASKV
jgi:hypothetical protein